MQDGTLRGIPTSIMDAIALSFRVWSCRGCGRVHNTDLHAAISIKTRPGTALHGAARPAMKYEARKSVHRTGLEAPSFTGAWFASSIRLEKKPTKT